MTPTRIPSYISRTDEPLAPPTIDMHGTWQPNVGAGRNSGPGVPWGTGTGMATVAPPPVVHIQPHRSVMMEGNLIDRIQPNYPPIAKAVRIQGAVILHAIISREGTIQNLQVISGHPMLVKAAMEAVKQWRYRPYVLNGQPVEVETQVTVNFVLAGGYSGNVSAGRVIISRGVIKICLRNCLSFAFDACSVRATEKGPRSTRPATCLFTT